MLDPVGRGRETTNLRQGGNETGIVPGSARSRSWTLQEMETTLPLPLLARQQVLSILQILAARKFTLVRLLILLLAISRDLGP